MSTLSKEQVAEIGDFIRNTVLDQMSQVFGAKLGIKLPTRGKMLEVIESGEFPEITGYYNEQVNTICDSLKSK